MEHEKKLLTDLYSWYVHTAEHGCSIIIAIVKVTQRAYAPSNVDFYYRIHVRVREWLHSVTRKRTQTLLLAAVNTGACALPRAYDVAIGVAYVAWSIPTYYCIICIGRAIAIINHHRVYKLQLKQVYFWLFVRYNKR